MKKTIITIVAIIMAMILVSCGETKSTVKRVTEGDCSVYVLEQTTDKDGKLIEEKQYIVTYPTPEEAWAEVYGPSN